MRHAPGERLDDYEIVDALGEGAYAEAYKAKDVRTGQLVVLKIPNPQLFADPALFSRYRREMDIARRLDHPRVVRSLDIGDHRTEPYLVLEFVEGEDLRKAVRRRGRPLPVPDVVHWARQLAEALAYLHANGIVHRDLKPENVLVDEHGDLKIADFGTAMLEGARRLTWKHLSESLGTPDYMSPEQVQGERGDARSDIYSWGVVVYELLTGAPPFRGDNWLAAMAGHLQGTPARIRQTRPDVPVGLEVIVLHAMRRYPADRYQSIEEILTDLDRIGPGDAEPAPGTVGRPAAAPGSARTAPPTPFTPITETTYNLSPEPPMGGMAAAKSAQRLWLYIALVAGGFVAAVALVILLEVLLR